MEIIICSCHGHVTENLPLNDIIHFLEVSASGVHVVVTDNLCEHNNLACFNRELESGTILVGACSRVKPKLSLWEKDTGKLATSVRVVDLLEELAMPYSSTIIAERVKLLLWAQLRRLSEPKHIYQDNLKLAFSRNREIVSRREFLASALPLYKVIPCVEPLKCAGGDKCRICYDTCLLKGIVIQGRSVTIDSDICDGCGACLASCPKEAIHYPTFSLEELHNEIEGLLIDDNVKLEPRIVSISCSTCLPSDCSDAKSPMVYAPNILPLKLPYLSMVSPWLLLSAFYMGAQGIAVIAGMGKCCTHISMPRLQNDIEFVQAVLGCWGIEQERLNLFKIADDNIDETINEVKHFARSISDFGPTPLNFKGRTLPSGKGLRLSALIEAISKRLEYQSKSSISGSMVPFGELGIDASKCTGCGICASSCPTGALSLKVNKDASEYYLVFRHGSCVACETCLSVCPESCLTLRRVLKMDKISHIEPILSDSIVNCRLCGNPVAPKLMIERLRSKLQGSGSCLDDQLELCSTCKIDTVCHVEDNLVTVVNKGLADKSQPHLGGI